MNLPVEASLAAVPADPYAQWWDYAQQIARALWAGLQLPPIGVYGPVRRYAPGDDSYTAINAMVLTRPARHRRRPGCPRNGQPPAQDLRAA